MTNKLPGVAVYPYVAVATVDATNTACVLGAIDEAVQAILALTTDDELDDCASRVTASSKERADNLSAALAHAVDVADMHTGWEALRTTGDPAVTLAQRALLALDALQMAALAKLLADADATFSDRLADMLLGNLGLDVPPVMPSERFVQNVLRRVADDEYRHQVALAQ